ncbi:hypothetical protein B4U80_06033 [Leptotrombidium deliense]|uniref:Gastric triacylglycerol lipase-like protein n=1 Tax=Leptotrombidium deliense TaxID=299467 RepID=A0A443S8Y3_9ACAR|nr:hypothetical protein B4U80_06033 [Leptotrombidium deliense]
MLIKTKMSYIGHSQGTTTLFGLLADNVKYNDKIDLFVAVTPVVKVEYSLALSVRMCMRVTNILHFMGGHFPFGYKFGRNVDKFLTRVVPVAKFYEAVIGGSVMGPFLHLNQSRLHVYIAHFGGASVWNGVRYLQDPKSFRHFDHGTEENIERYGTETPPEYDITKITTKVALISGTHDFLASVFDVDYVRKNLRNVVLDYVAYKQNHIDILIGLNVTPIVKMILELLENT